MSQGLPSDPWLVRVLLRCIHLAHRRPLRTIAVIGIASVGLGLFASTHLSFNVDPNALFSQELRFQQMIEKFSRHFPVLTDSILIVIDEGPPEATRRTQLALAEALEKRTDVFHRVFLPGEEPFFEHAGLLYGDVDELDAFADQMAQMQPLLAELAQDPTLPTLTRLIELGLKDAGEKDAAASAFDTTRWTQVLDRLRSSTASAFEAMPVSVSWEQVFLADTPFDSTPLRVIVADPILDLDRVLAAEDAIEAIRTAILDLDLDLDKSGQGGPAGAGVRVRITGYPALNHEEMIGLATDTGLAGALSFLLVVGVLTRAYRSARMVVAAAFTLATGLVWSAAFAGATVAELNPLSITFGVLVIGLGVDFMIHFGMHLAQHLRGGSLLGDAFAETIRETGPALVLCAATTAVGFLAFVPTAYHGVSDLGLVAAGGIGVMLLMTLTLLPALLSVLLSQEAVTKLAGLEASRHRILPLLPPFPVCAIALGLGILALTRVADLELDTDVIRMRNPQTESVQAFRDLLEDGLATPWYVDVLAPSLSEADELAEKIAELELVDRVFTLSDLVPAEQAEKLEILADITMFLDLPAAGESAAPSPSEQVAAIAKLRAFLAVASVAQGDDPLARSAQRLRSVLDNFLSRATEDPGPALETLEALLLDPLPAQLERLRENLAVEEIGFADLPTGLRERMISEQGFARIQVYPREDLLDQSAMVRFVEAIRLLSSEITGLPVNLVESARASWASLREALLWSGLAIAALLLVIWRSPSDTAIAMLPLGLAVLLTQVSTEVLPISFNFTNVVVLPLILGIGIDSGVHLVSRAKTAGSTENLLASTTARAVLYSAITTVASFGTLAISGHRGVASLGVLLVVGMLWTLAANLILLPALLTLRIRSRATASCKAAP